jgi:hypothetical protein
MESNAQRTPEIDGGFDGYLPNQRGKGWRRLSDDFAIIGPMLQQPRQFFMEIRDGIGLVEKIRALLVTSTVFLAIYGAMLGSGYILLSLNVAIAVPFLFLGSLATCIPVMYLLDVLTGSQRSLVQIVAVLLTSLTAAATVFFSFAPIMVVFNLTGTLVQFFWLNVGILAMAMLVGLKYMVQGIIQTAVVDAGHAWSKINRQLHFMWMLLFLMVSIQIGWGLLSFYQRTGGFLMLLIQQLE